MADKQIEPTYDKWGRMNYNPEYHANHKKDWTVQDQKYLIENYALLGPEQVSFALERTIHTVQSRAYELRKAGLMAKPVKRTNSKRIMNSTSRDV